jgi:hypothetical protein
VVKGEQKLIGELFDQKNEEAMNSILHEASRKGFMKMLAYPTELNGWRPSYQFGLVVGGSLPGKSTLCLVDCCVFVG